MRSKPILHAALLILALTGLPAFAQSVPAQYTSGNDWGVEGAVSVNVGIGNESFNDIQIAWQAQTDPVTGITTYTMAGNPITLLASDGSSLTLNSAFFDPDPVLLFSASATNNSNNPLAYSFSFNTPLTPALTGAVSSHAELGVTLTDGLNDGATIAPLAGQNFILKSYDLYANAGSISKNVDIGTAYAIFSGTSGTSFAADSSLVCGQPCVTMSAQLAFVLTAHDSAGFSGKVVQVSQVPLPAGLGLLGSGLAALLGLRRRQRPGRQLA